MVSTLLRHRTLILQMARREIVARYRGSVMGVFWSLLNPLLMLVVYTFVFSVVFKARWHTGAQQSHTDFAIILFVGVIVHTLFSEVAGRAPSLILGYAQRLGKMPISYNLYSEYGRWYGSGIHSNHWVYGISVAHDTIPFHGFELDLAAGYSITRESYDHSRVQGMNASAFLTKEFNDRLAAYVGYLYTKNTKQNALFAYGQEDYSKVWQVGMSLRIDKRNRIAIGGKYAQEPRTWTDVDYYWFHDLHCSQIILRWRSKQNSLKIKWEFTPW